MKEGEERRARRKGEEEVEEGEERGERRKGEEEEEEENDEVAALGHEQEGLRAGARRAAKAVRDKKAKGLGRRGGAVSQIDETGAARRPTRKGRAKAAGRAARKRRG